MLFFRCFVLFCCLFLAFQVWSQPNCSLSISGQVIDLHDRSGLGFATIYINEIARGAVADEDGNYLVERLCAGTYTIVCAHLGCEKITKTVVLRQNTTLNFYPEHHTEALNEVEIDAKRTDLHTQTSDGLSNDALEQTRGKSLAEALTALGGVRMLQTGSNVAKPIIQGLHSNRIVTMNNDVRQEDQQWGSDHGLNIDPFTAGSVEVIKGAAAVQYGAEAIGGVILVHPRPMPLADSTLHGSVFLGARTNGRGGIFAAYIEGVARHDWAWRVQTSATRLGDSEAPKYVLSNTAKADLNASVTLLKRSDDFSLECYYSLFETNSGILRAAHIGNLTDLEAALASGEPTIIRPFTYAIQNPRQAATHQLMKIAYTRRKSLTRQYTIKYSGQLNQRREFDIRRGDRDSIPALNLWLSTHEVKYDNHLKINAFWDISGGLEGRFQYNYNLPGTGVKALLPDYLRWQTGAFAMARYTRKDVVAEVGVRADAQYYRVKKVSQGSVVPSDFVYPNMALSSGLVYHPNKKFTLNTNISTAYRAPAVIELFSQGLHHAVAAIQEGNPELQPENAVKATVGLEWKPTQKLTFKIDGFAQSIKNYIYLEPQPEPRLTVRGAFPVFIYRQTDAFLGGTDMQVTLDITNELTYQAQYSLLRHRDLRKKTYLIFQPSDQFQHRIEWQKNIRNQIIRLGATHQFVAQQTRYPIGIDFAAPPKSYQLFSATVSWQKTTQTGQNIRLQLDADNVLDTPYRDYLDMLRYYADSPGRNIQIKIWLNF